MSERARVSLKWIERWAGGVATLPRSEAGYHGVYFVQWRDFIKIGSAWDVRARARAIWQNLPDEDLWLLGWIPAAPASPASLREAFLHREFTALRVRGEWFRAEEPLLSFIAARTKPWPDTQGVPTCATKIC